MQISAKDLTVGFEHVDREALLSDWEWLIGPHRLPILISAVGDAFVQDTRDGTVHQLDATFGELDPVAADDQELRALLGDREFVMDRLAVQLYGDLRQAGLELGPGQVYSWKVLPALGGEIALENAEVADLEVHFSITGQLHRQIKDLPVGTPISEIRIEEP
jgi:Domain of unknown function (DUF1851)